MASQTTCQSNSCALDTSMTRACAASSCQMPGTGVYIPPDRPMYHPNMYTPPEAASDAIGVDSSHISPYCTLPDTMSMLTGDMVGDPTGTFMAGAGRNRFTQSLQTGAGKERDGESTMTVKELHGTSSLVPATASVPGSDTVRNPFTKPMRNTHTKPLPVSTPFRGPGATPYEPPGPGEIDDTYCCDTDRFVWNTQSSGEACFDEKQPSWPPKFVNRGGERVQGSMVPPLPVYSATASESTSQAYRSSPSGDSEVNSTGTSSSRAAKQASAERGRQRRCANGGGQGSKQRTFTKLFSCFS